jgi:shikimate dehydrogenase
MKLYGLIGKTLKHSFSKQYFTDKFQRENIAESQYELFELTSASELKNLLTTQPTLVGLNVTIPYKQDIVSLVDTLDSASAGRIGAVNTIKIYPDGITKGFNSDYYGFKQSLEDWLKKLDRTPHPMKALILGTGGASKAVAIALQDLYIPYQYVSRTSSSSSLAYEDLTQEILTSHQLIINTTPLGMYPSIEACPPIPYEYLGSAHLLYDLVYNPLETLFMKKGIAQGAAAFNGLEMLHLQAEKSWEIWNNDQA